MARRLSEQFLRGTVVSWNVPYDRIGRNYSGKLFAVYGRRPVSAHFSAKAGRSVDVKLIGLLEKEIQSLRQLDSKCSVAKQSLLQDFNVIASDDTEVTFSKTHHNGEKINVKFNVAKSVEDKFSKQHLSHPEGKPRLTFRVEIEKNNQRLGFECKFVVIEVCYENGESIPHEDQDDQFAIVSVHVIEDGEITNKMHCSDGGSISEGNLYGHLMNYLQERGINNRFVLELILLSLIYKHGRHVDLLEKLRIFLLSE